jgi:hypothetical protein
VFATERDDPLTKLALDVLGAYHITFKNLHVKSLNLNGNVRNDKLYKCKKACTVYQWVEVYKRRMKKLLYLDA